MMYPPAPWQMYGESWISVFRVKEGDHPERPRGMYGVMMVRYDEPSPLTYHELLVGRLVDRKFANITDIWVDSEASMQGGRELWAIPKHLCDFSFEVRTNPISTRLRASASVDGRSIASCFFHDAAGVIPRVPFKGQTQQTRDSGELVQADLTGTAKTMPAIGSWQFAPDGPLGWLHDKRPYASARMRNFQMSFG
ncbi:MAG TPA: acetoacetate decarboxylase family protein [Marmoricola sp.]|nr:acetoacetate decarboxylase family protein [Marmoricola sp.]